MQTPSVMKSATSLPPSGQDGMLDSCAQQIGDYMQLRVSVCGTGGYQLCYEECIRPTSVPPYSLLDAAVG